MARAGGITNAVNVGIAVQADWENREFISHISLNVRRLFDFLVQFGTIPFPLSLFHFSIQIMLLLLLLLLLMFFPHTVLNDLIQWLPFLPQINHSLSPLLLSFWYSSLPCETTQLGVVSSVNETKAATVFDSFCLSHWDYAIGYPMIDEAYWITPKTSQVWIVLGTLFF